MPKNLTIVNENRLYLRLIQLGRNYLLGSESKEQLNKRLRRFYKLLYPLFLRNGPRRRQDVDVADRLEFMYKNVDKDNIVADVGCFDGYFSQKLREHGCKVIGVDSLDLVIQRTTADDPTGKYLVSFAEDMPFRDSSFDIGIYSHVLEHVFSPESALSEARRVIKDGGKIIVIVPFDLGVDANHLREYSKDNLVTLVSKFFPEVTYHNQIGEGHGCVGVNFK